MNELRREHILHEEVVPTPEQKSHIEQALRDVLATRTAVVDAGWAGEGALAGKYAGSLIGAEGVHIDRCDPPLDVPRFQLGRGKSIVLVGANGSGKSTFLDAMQQRMSAEFSSRHGKGGAGYGEGIHQEGKLRIARLNQEELFDAVRDMKVADVLDQVVSHYKEEFPDVYGELDGTQGDAEMQAIIARAEKNADAQQRLESLASRVRSLFEIDHFVDRKVGELSGGERTKLSLFMLLASEPDVMFLDEPTNHLDLESIGKLMGIFQSYTKDGVGVICSSHVKWFLEQASKDGTAEIQRKSGKRELTMSGSAYGDFAKSREGKPIVREIRWDQEVEARKGQTLFSAAASFDIPDSPLAGVELPTISGGDIYVVHGKNGTGKTKFLEALAHKGGPISREKGVQVAYMPQFWPEEIAEGRVEDFFHWVKEGINPHDHDRGMKQFAKRLNDIGFPFQASRIAKEPLSRFSGGEQRLLWFAAASIFDGTDVLILDEPSNHMDEPTMKVITEAIRNFDGTVVLSTHDLPLMKELEADLGTSRQSKSVRGIVFERDSGGAMMYEDDEKPSVRSENMISAAMKQGARLKRT